VELDPVLLSRVQFSLTIMFHYLFPPLTIGLGAVMVGIETVWLLTRDPRYEAMARFWTKIFAINFAMGVATGIVMEFQFGTNWAAYSRYVGDVFGSILAAEGIFAFFLESGFLSVLVFGWDKVSRPVHFFATLMVFLGSVFSSVWIVIANSWMQTPVGYHLVETPLGTRAEITDFASVVFNPSTVERLLHVWTGSLILGAFFVMSVSAWYVLRGRHLDFAHQTFKIALAIGTFAAYGALFTGHLSAEVVAEHQPAKLAAFEGHYRTGPGDMYLWGIPNDETGEVEWGFAIPGGLSFLVHWNFVEPIQGLYDIPRDEWPPVAAVFQSYHAMVALGVTFIVMTTLACVFWARGTLFRQRWLLWLFVVAVIGAYAANQLGWFSAEVGRQPWIVYGLLRTSDGVSEGVSGASILSSIVLFGVVYLLLFIVWVYVMNAKIQHGPDPVEGEPPPEARSLLEAVSRWVNPAGWSLSGAKDAGWEPSIDPEDARHHPQPEGSDGRDR